MAVRGLRCKSSVNRNRGTDRLVKVLRVSNWVDGSNLVIERRKVGSDNELAKREAAKSARHRSDSVRLVRYFCLAEAATGMPH